MFLCAGTCLTIISRVLFLEIKSLQSFQPAGKLRVKKRMHLLWHLYRCYCSWYATVSYIGTVDSLTFLPLPFSLWVLKRCLIIGSYTGNPLLCMNSSSSCGLVPLQPREIASPPPGLHATLERFHSKPWCNVSFHNFLNSLLSLVLLRVPISSSQPITSTSAQAHLGYQQRGELPYQHFACSLSSLLWPFDMHNPEFSWKLPTKHLKVRKWRNSRYEYRFFLVVVFLKHVQRIWHALTFQWRDDLANLHILLARFLHLEKC